MMTSITEESWTVRSSLWYNLRIDTVWDRVGIFNDVVFFHYLCSAIGYINPSDEVKEVIMNDATKP